MIGFASLDDMVRVYESVQFTESQRPETRRGKRTIRPAWTPAIYLGKTDAAVNKSTVASPASVTVSVWSGSSISGLTDTGDNITAYSMFGNVASGKFVLCIGLNMGNLIFAAECA